MTRIQTADVLILGAGASGLAAARELTAAGLNIRILDSYVPVGAPAAQRILAEPLEQTLYFAGEATDTTHQQGTRRRRLNQSALIRVHPWPKLVAKDTCAMMPVI